MESNIADNEGYKMKNSLAVMIIIILSACSVYARDKRALLIGISDYPEQHSADLTWKRIHGANDVNLIRRTLRQQNFEITTLTDANATASNIRRAFKHLYAESGHGDLVYIHFSGHGQPYEDFSGDEDDGWDESIVPYNAMRCYRKGIYDGCCHIIDDEMEKYISAIRTKIGERGYVYFVLDACHAGGASRGDEMCDDEQYARGTDQGFSPTCKKYIPRIDRRGNMKVQSRPGMSGICILEACRAYQINVEIKQSGRYYGPLTYYVNQVLQDIELSADCNWVERVRANMEKDRRLVKQNMVIEKSDK